MRNFNLSKIVHLAADLLGTPRRIPLDNKIHIEEAVRWIYRAHDATPDRGVSHSYVIGKGWAPSYPETTGYIIPTLLNWAVIADNDEARRRALEMADWEISIQLDSGAVMGSVIGASEAKPVVFNTGQVIFGWVSAYRVTGDGRYLNAAVRAADWLVDKLDENHTWSSHGNLGIGGIHTYNVRCVWAILELVRVAGKDGYVGPMKAFLEWVLGQEAGRGWFHHNCLNNNDQPLLHTIAYTARGLLESGLLLADTRYIEACTRTADELLKHVAEDGSMPGRFDQDWNAAVRWSCLTGMAQTSIIWNKLYRMTGKGRYLTAARKVNDYLKRTQGVSGNNLGTKGGIKGSYPLNGEYGKYRVLNWATKFFIDALLLDEYPDFPSTNSYQNG